MRAKDPKNDQHFRHFAGAGAFAGITVILICMAFSDDHGSLYKWLKEWQTMIAGLAAVAAAFLSIQKMDQTDKSSDKRHRELVRLQMRADGLRVERAYDPCVRRVRAALSRMRLFAEEAEFALSQSQDPDELRRGFPLDKGIGASLLAIAKEARNCKAALQLPQIAEARNLFNSATTEAHDRAILDATFLSSFYDQGGQFMLNKVMVLNSSKRLEYEPAVRQVLTSVNGLREHSERFCIQLTALLVTYENKEGSTF